MRTVKVCFIFLLIQLTVVLTLFSLGLLSFLYSFSKLEPKSPSGVQLLAQTASNIAGASSTIYIKYPNRIFPVEADAVFTEMNGTALISQTQDNPHIEWIDAHHVSITFTGQNYQSPDTEIIEY